MNNMQIAVIGVIFKKEAAISKMNCVVCCRASRDCLLYMQVTGAVEYNTQ